MVSWEKAHADLARLFSWPGGYAGYKPEVAEAPNGDTKVCDNCGGTGGTNYDVGCFGRCLVCRGTGRVPNVDAGRAGKRYLHVARKYLGHTPALAFAEDYLARAHYEACRVAETLRVPAAYYPRAEFGALRVLEYPSAEHTFEPTSPRKPDGTRNRRKCGCKKCSACGELECESAAEEIGGRADSVCPALAAGAGTAEHRDFDLFTLNLWRSTPHDHERYEHATAPDEMDGWVPGIGPSAYHIGEIGELVGLGPAVLHRVPARPYVQKALVYFAIPDHGARLPYTAYAKNDPFHNMLVGEWLSERMARSRVTK